MKIYAKNPVFIFDGGVNALEYSKETTTLSTEWARICVEQGGATQAWFAQVDENLNIDWLAGWPMVSQPRWLKRESRKDLIQEGKTITFFDIEESASVATFPILNSGQIIALLALKSIKPDFFLPDTVAWIEALTTVISSSITQVKQESKWRQAIHTINRILQSSLELKEELDLVLGILGELVEMDMALVFKCDPFSKRFEVLATHGTDHDMVGKPPLYFNLETLSEGFPAQVQFHKLSEIFHSEMHDYYFQKGYQTYVGMPFQANGNVFGVMEIFWRTPQADLRKLNIIKMVVGAVSWEIERTSIVNDLRQHNDELTSTYTATIEGLSRALELRDLETEGHTRRVSELTLQLAQHMQIPEDQHDYLVQGALLHDIGKLGIPDAILFKPGSLTPQEWDVMRQHPQYAYNILAPIISLRQTLDIPLYHHEHWNGSGYPFGLRGEQIPLSARLFTVVDVFDALISDRPYRSAWPRSHALTYIRENAGKLFDPQITEVFLDLFNTKH